MVLLARSRGPLRLVQLRWRRVYANCTYEKREIEYHEDSRIGSIPRLCGAGVLKGGSGSKAMLVIPEHGLRLWALVHAILIIPASFCHGFSWLPHCPHTNPGPVLSITSASYNFSYLWLVLTYHSHSHFSLFAPFGDCVILFSFIALISKQGHLIGPVHLFHAKWYQLVVGL